MVTRSEIKYIFKKDNQYNRIHLHTSSSVFALVPFSTSFWTFDNSPASAAVKSLSPLPCQRKSINKSEKEKIMELSQDTLNSPENMIENVMCVLASYENSTEKDPGIVFSVTSCPVINKISISKLTTIRICFIQHVISNSRSLEVEIQEMKSKTSGESNIDHTQAAA